MLEEAARNNVHPVLEWLERYPEPAGGADSADAQQLVRWLHGDDGATAGESVDPPVWILSSLEDAAFPGSVRRQLALHCRILLERRPDRMLVAGDTSRFWRAGQYLHNLLRLCSELPAPEILWEPLLAIYRDNLLPATVDGYGITDPFRAALIRNQLGPDLEGEWFAMLRGESSRLGGTRMSGLRGVLAMPQSSATLGRPWTSQIARALGEMARYLEKFPDKRQQFRLLVSDAQKPFGSTLHHYDLIAGAIESNWPVWAVEANCLYVKAPGATARHMRAYLWKYIAECIPESYPSQRLNSYFDGAFFEMELSAEALEYVDEIAPLFEENLLGNPFSSVGAMTCVVAKVTDQLERRMRSKGKRLAAKAILSARERVLGQVYSATVILHPKKSWTPQKGIDQFKAGRWETQDLSGVHGWIEELRAR